MKKTVVALAVLAASGASMAQVTLYGLVDAGFKAEKIDNGTTSLTVNKIDSGLINGSRWGVKGTEDLGGGLKAIFNMENGFNIDDGTQGQGRLFGRAAWVGISGDFGAIKAGRISTPYYDLDGQTDAVWDGALSPLQYVGRSNNGSPGGIGPNFTARQNNQVKYESPKFMGDFTAAISYSLGENTAANTATTPKIDAGSTVSFNVAYISGPLNVSLAYQEEKITDALKGANVTRLNASYDFGIAKVMFAYGKSGNVGALGLTGASTAAQVAAVDGADSSDWQLGVDYPVNSALTLSASYAGAEDNKQLINGQTRDGLGLGARYALSKRTFVYGGYEYDTRKASGTKDITHDIFALGVQHRF